MTLSEMRRLLVDHNIRLTKSLGQNFLHDGNQLRRIVDLAQFEPGQDVLEIGPGFGPLTEVLLHGGAKVLCIEKDVRLAALLRHRIGNHASLTCLDGDALDYVAEPCRDWTAWHVVANLPYSVGSPILIELATHRNPPARMTVTLQAEVVRRLRAAPGCKDYGLLTLLVGLRYVARSSFRIPPGCFFPAPEVESGCIRLDRRPDFELSASHQRAYGRLVRRAFSQRRKHLWKLLKADWPQPALDQARSAFPWPERVRGEALAREDYIALAKTLQPV